MSGLYNTLFGENDHKGFLLGLLDATTDDFNRFRDVYATEKFIVVHTRCGGGNREDYFPEWVENHPLYSHDEDDDFDCTYADIYFKHPEGYEDVLKEMAEGVITPAEKWQLLFAAMEKAK